MSKRLELDQLGGLQNNRQRNQPMDKFDLKSRERLIRVEDGVINIKELLKAHIDQPPCTQFGCTIKEDIVSLRGTQKWTRIVAKTGVGSAIVAIVGLIIKGIIHLA